MIYYELCNICPFPKMGIIKVNGVVFCADCEKRELDHNLRMTGRVIGQVREEMCKYFDICEYRKEDGYTCNHADEAKHFCGKYRELDKN